MKELVAVSSRYFKEMHETCERFKSKIGSKPQTPVKVKAPRKRSTDSDSDRKPQKRKYKKRFDPLRDDPYAPKKPIMQGYLLYFTEQRKIKQREHPELSNKELTKAIGLEWNELPREQKLVRILIFCI